MALLMAYMKDVQKEVRADTAFQKQIAKNAVAAKAGKIEQDNRAIDQGMKEAQEKANAQMSAATTSLAIGVAQGLTQIAGASSIYAKAPSDQESRRLVGTANALKSDLAKLSADLKRNDKRLSAGEANRMKEQLEKGLQEVRNAKKSARPC